MLRYIKINRGCPRTNILRQPLTLFTVVKWSANGSKSFLAGNHHIVRATGAVDDHDITAAVKAANNADMAVTRIKDKVSRLGVTPSNRRTVAVLRSGPAAMPKDGWSAALGVLYPIHHYRTIQAESSHSSMGGAAFGSDLHRHSPAGIPADHQRFSAPKIMDSA